MLFPCIQLNHFHSHPLSQSRVFTNKREKWGKAYKAYTRKRLKKPVDIPTCSAGPFDKDEYMKVTGGEDTRGCSRKDVDSPTCSGRPPVKTFPGQRRQRKKVKHARKTVGLYTHRRSGKYVNIPTCSARPSVKYEKPKLQSVIKTFHGQRRKMKHVKYAAKNLGKNYSERYELYKLE